MAPEMLVADNGLTAKLFAATVPLAITLAIILFLQYTMLSSARNLLAS
jgi:hypothetical protein